jgi:3',5'-cyclic-AMP phosphodiesterase
MPQPIRLFQITDTHCFADDDTRLTWTNDPVYPNRSLQAVLGRLKNQCAGYSALMLTGDLAQEEIGATYRRLSENCAGFPLPIYALPGNHDDPKVMSAHLSGNVTLPEQTTLGAWHLLLLNTHRAGQPYGDLSENDFLELQTTLNRIPHHEFVAVFMHHNPLDVGSEWLDVMGFKPKARFWSLLEKAPQVKAVFHGHIHQEFLGQHEYSNGRKIGVYGTPSTCIQGKPRRKTVEFDHIVPAWRTIALRPDGAIETEVHYLSPRPSEPTV